MIIVSIITAVAGLVTAVAGLVTATKGHQKNAARIDAHAERIAALEKPGGAPQA